MLTPLDRDRLRDALSLAETAIGVSDPNPRVGCVVGRADGSVLGRGATQRAGDAHAEVMALRDAASSSASLAGATAWVTLEPCAHHGRTPPCCDALIAAGITRVVVAIGDPYRDVDSAGIARLRAAGVCVDLAEDGDIVDAARDINVGFFSRIERGRPWVRLKVAASLDGRTALADGTSQWITGAAAREDGHRWRRRAGAVLTGIGTVLRDDPRLDVRLVPSVLQPLRVVADSSLRMPLSARVLDGPGRVLLAAARVESDDKTAALRARGAEVLAFAGQDGGVGLEALCRHLATRGVNELHVEAGAGLNAALLQARLVDELLLYVAPKLLGPGAPIAALKPLAALSDAPEFTYHETRKVGDDLRLLCRCQCRRT